MNPELALGSEWGRAGGPGFLNCLFLLVSLVTLDPVLSDSILEKSEQHTVAKLPWDSLLTR